LVRVVPASSAAVVLVDVVGIVDEALVSHLTVHFGADERLLNHGFDGARVDDEAVQFLGCFDKRRAWRGVSVERREGKESERRTRPLQFGFVPQLDADGEAVLHAVHDETGKGTDGGDEEVGDYRKANGKLAVGQSR
jgi:hypothetical protein